MEKLFTELPQGAQYVLLHRRNDRDATKWDHEGKIPTADFSVEAVKEQYGGGDYRVQPVGEKGRFLGQPVEFSIDHRFKPTRGPLAVGDAITEAGAAAGGGNTLARIEKLLEMNLMLSMRGQHAPGAAAPVTDPFEGALKIATLMKGSQAGPSVTEMMETLFKGMKIGQDMAGGERSGFAALADSATPLFGALAKSIEADAEAKARRSLRVMPAAPNPLPGEPVPMPTWHDSVRPYIPQLVKLAQAEKDPELYADLVLDQLSAEVYDQVEREARNRTAPEFLELFLAAFPELRAYQLWCQEFFGRIHAELTAPAEPDAANTGH